MQKRGADLINRVGIFFNQLKARRHSCCITAVDTFNVLSTIAIQNRSLIDLMATVVEKLKAINATIENYKTATTDAINEVATSTTGIKEDITKLQGLLADLDVDNKELNQVVDSLASSTDSLGVALGTLSTKVGDLKTVDQMYPGGESEPTQPGEDTNTGSTGEDTLNSGEGNDTITGSEGDNTGNTI